MMVAKVSSVTMVAPPWDLGPLTDRQIAGKVIEPVISVDPETGKASNPNNVIRTRRETWIGRYHRKGKLSDAQANIAAELFDVEPHPAQGCLLVHQPVIARRPSGRRCERGMRQEAESAKPIVDGDDDDTLCH